MRKRRSIAGLVGVALMISIAGCQSGGPASGKGHHAGSSTIHIALAGDPSSLDPQAVEDGNALAVYDNISEALLTRSPTDNKVQPQLALSWKSIDPKTWQFTLRKGVTFSDGEPFNADAAVFSIKRIINPKYSTQQTDWTGDINGATKVDNYTVDITSAAPDPQVPERMSLIMMVPPVAGAKASFATHPIGTGPYTLASYTKGSQYVLKARSDYWGGKPSIPEAIMQPISEQTLRLSSLNTGEINVVSDLLPEQISQVPHAAKVPGLEFPTLILNTRGGPFKSKLVRQAANYAIDKQTLLNKLYSGFGTIANCQIMGPATFGYDPNLKPYPYDPAKAKALLAQAGDTHPSITLIGDSTNRWLKDVELEQSLAGYLEKVGFTVNVKLADFTTYLSELFPKKNSATVARPDSVFVSHDNVLGDADVTFSTYYQSTGSGASTSSPQIDSLVASARTELDTAKLRAMYQQVNQLGCSDADFIFLFNLENVYGTTADLNWQPRYDAMILVKTMSWK
ncbi:MAG: ABC transporter substrate-binding protein [Jatrophihabitantaceae bacterium]